MPSQGVSKTLSSSAFYPSVLSTVCLIVLALLLEPLTAQFLKASSWSKDDATSMFTKISAFALLMISMTWILPFITRRLRNLNNGIPGRRIAKLTTLWKLVHRYKGTYGRLIKELHDKHGAVVQVGPAEYSIGSSKGIPFCCELGKVGNPDPSLFPSLSTGILKALSEALSMASVFHNEPNIDQCNFELLKKLFSSAESGEEVKLVDLVARYAYDVLFATTVGKSPGFQHADVSKLEGAMKQWKFYAVLNGSYLRFHPIIARVLRLFGFGKSVVASIADQFEGMPENDAHCMFNGMRKASEGQPFQSKEALEACIALIIAGSDPVITHVFASIVFAYQDTADTAGLIDALRSEIDRANLSQPPTLKELIHAKPRMSLLHAVLQESRRLWQTANNSLNYIAPKGGVKILDKHVPEGCTICLETSVAHVNPDIFGVNADSFDPKRWLEHPAVARNLRSHMVTFGAASDLCSDEDFHLSVVAKVFSQVVAHFDITMNSTTALKSPTHFAFYDLKDRYYAKVSLPKSGCYIQNVTNSTLRATAPAFAPETRTAPELPPGLSPTKISFANADINNGAYKAVGGFITRVGGTEASGDKVDESIGLINAIACDSPSLSIAATATTSSTVSSTPLTWADEQELEELLGRPVTNELINRFDPTTNLKPQAPLKTGPLNTPRERFQLHKIIERVWTGRLIHETARRDNAMHIWVPGSKVPKWLQAMHQKRQSNDRKNAGAGAPAPGHVAPAAQQGAAPVKAPRPVNAVWTNFAVDENVRYDGIAKMSGDEYVAMMAKKAEEAGTKKADDAEPKFTLKETFKLTGVDATKATSDATHASEDVPKKTTVPPHMRPRMALPPHLRAKSSASDDQVHEKKAEKENDEGTWVAAKLPFPSSTE